MEVEKRTIGRPRKYFLGKLIVNSHHVDKVVDAYRRDPKEVLEVIYNCKKTSKSECRTINTWETHFKSVNAPFVTVLNGDGQFSIWKVRAI